MGNAPGNASAALSVEPVEEETSSSCLTQSITVAHNFEVINFSLLEGMGAGEFVSSRNFHVGGCVWNIRLYPDGFAAGQIAPMLAFYSNPQGGEREGMRVRFTFTISGKDGKVWRKEANKKQTFKSPFLTRGGWYNFLHKSNQFRTLLRDSNDSFMIRCVLTVVQDPRVEDVSSIIVPEPSVLRDLATMLRDGDGADVTFVVGGRSFPAHRCVLAARSAVFRAELFGSMKEKAATLVMIEDMEPSIFEALLHFVYTDSLPDVDSCHDRNVPMQHLLVAADRYGLDRLRLLCEVRMCRSIDAHTVATTLALAEQHGCVQLKKACLGFIASGGVLGAVVKTGGFCHLAKSCPSILLEILDKLASLGI